MAKEKSDKKLEHSEIKKAVSQGDSLESEVPAPGSSLPPGPEMPPVEEPEKIGGHGKPSTVEYSEDPELRPSISENQQQEQESSQETSQEIEAYPEEQYPPQDYGGQVGGGYDQYQPYQDVMSSDVITEISEQVVEERLSEMHDRLEKAISFRNIAETKIINLDDRLRRIEQILDRLQLSLLQKVGDYVNDVRDIRTEMEETRKSFKKLLPELKGSSERKDIP